VTTTLLDQFGHELLEAVLPLPPMLLRVLRVLRILRVLRLLKSKRAKGLRDLMMTLVLSAPALVNISSLLALLMGMYAVLGVQLFTYVAHGDALLTDDRNFNNFGSALLLLFQVLTGDDWAAIMSDCMASPESSSCTVEEGNCGTAAAIPYFVSFQVLGSFVMLNLVVAVILENFTTLGNVNPNLISSNDIANFKEAWAEIDPDANGLAPISDLANVLNALPPPMGFKGGGGAWNTAKVRRYIESLKLTDHDGEVKFQEVIDKIVRDKEPKGMAEASTSGKASASSSKGGFDLASLTASAKALAAQDSPKLDQLTGPATLGTKRLSAGVVSAFDGAAKNMKAEGDKLKDKLKESEEKLKELGKNLKESRPGGRPSGPRQLL